MVGLAVGAYLGTIYFFLIFVCIFIVLYYAEKGSVPWHTYLTLVIGYYASFGILLLVPIDIASCVVDRRSTAIGSYAPYNDNLRVLNAAYDTFFTLILIMGSVVLVLEEYYNTDGKREASDQKAILFHFNCSC